jgi:glycine cleavage system H protein
MTPSDRKYTPTHEWIKIEGPLALVGITDHAQEALGDLTFVESPRVGKKVQKEEACGVVESVKAASDIYAPLTGEVAEVNSALESDPGILNESPYEEGWIYKLKNFDAAAVESLLDARGYEATLK